MSDAAVIVRPLSPTQATTVPAPEPTSQQRQPGCTRPASVARVVGSMTRARVSSRSCSSRTCSSSVLIRYDWISSASPIAGSASQI